MSKSREIVEHLAGVDWAHVTDIAEAVDRPVPTTRALLSYLHTYHGRVEQVPSERGAWRITAKGRHYLENESAWDDGPIAAPAKERLTQAARVLEPIAARTMSLLPPSAAPSSRARPYVFAMVGSSVAIIAGDTVIAYIHPADAQAIADFLKAKA